MIELAIKASLERITGMDAYPLLLPPDVMTGITYQRISDPAVETGLARTRLVEGRFQVTFYVVDMFTRLVTVDRDVWSVWQGIVHSHLEGYDVQFIERAGLQDGQEILNNGSIVYSRRRDYLITFSE
ncbi:hypothetical protein RYR42_002715 [Edwardsiella piscicida]|nr:hypothetical protein [Edwardsiella piscicida]